jgi:hypothetical protein
MSIKENYQEVKEKLIELFGKDFFQDVISLVLMLISLIIFLALTLILVFRLQNTDSLVPLFYNSTYGVVTSVTWYKLYFLPAAYFLILAVNILIAWAFFDKERLITYLTLFVTVIAGLLLIIEEVNITSLIRG